MRKKLFFIVAVAALSACSSINDASSITSKESNDLGFSTTDYVKLYETPFVGNYLMIEYNFIQRKFSFEYLSISFTKDGFSNVLWKYSEGDDCCAKYNYSIECIKKNNGSKYDYYPYLKFNKVSGDVILAFYFLNESHYWLIATDYQTIYYDCPVYDSVVDENGSGSNLGSKESAVFTLSNA